MDDRCLARLVSHCRGQLEPMAAVLREICEINSFSSNLAGGAAVVAVLERELSAIEGVETSRVDSQRFAPHLLATTTSARSSAAGCVALLGHHDTVFAPGSFTDFARAGDVAHGPGVADMKGGLVVMLFALRALGAEGLLARLPLRLLSVADEEVGSPEGATVLAQQLGGAACALVFEAGRAADAIITRRKGTGGVRAIAHGKAAHAGNEHAAGVNAIWALARMVDAAQGLTDYDRGVTINVGTIAGGQGRNTVPDRAEALFDLRFVALADGHELVAGLHRAAEQAAASVPGSRIELLGGVARPPLERTAASLALYHEYAACARAAGLGHGEAQLVGGGSDASTAAALGIPSIDGLGPRGTGFHTPAEQIELPTLVQRLEALVRFLYGRAVALSNG